LRISLFPLLFLALPLAEIAGFVLVGSEIGALNTIGLVLASTVIGSLLIRHQGLGVMARARAEMDAGRDPSRQIAHGAMAVFAAVLLIVPGFITSALGLLFLLPPVRDLAWRYLSKRIVVATDFSRAGFGGSRRNGKTIDLDDEDYRRSDGNPDGRSPWHRLPED
jgi:UPF0716 protein FxsA